jgi:hypothetical protein
LGWGVALTSAGCAQLRERDRVRAAGLARAAARVQALEHGRGARRETLARLELAVQK